MSAPVLDSDRDRPIVWEPSLAFLRFVLLFLTVGATIYLVSLRILVPNQTWRAFAVVGVIGVTAASWGLLQREKYAASMWTLAIGAWTASTVTSFYLGGVLGPATAMYPLPILLIGWLVGARAAIICALLTSCTALMWVILESSGRLPVASATPALMRWMIQSGVWFLTAMLIRSVASSYRHRLDDLRALHQQHVRAELELGDRDRRLTAVFESSPLPILISTVAEGRVLEINEAATRLYGAPAEAIVGRTMADLNVYANGMQRQVVIDALMGRRFLDQFPVDIRVGNGEIKSMEVYGRLIDLQGEPCLLAMLMDVTERNRLSEARLRTQKLESLGTLAGGIAHDFNNILTAISGNADLAAWDLGPDHKAGQRLAEIRKATLRASELVRRIMVFGRPSEAHHENVSLAPVVDEVLYLLRSTVPARIDLRIECAGTSPVVMADASQIHEVLVNLTTNAVHAIGDQGGVITYRIESVTLESASAPAGLVPGRYARLIVTDSGCGMDAAQLERIFDAFYTTKPVGEGTGLGLSIVHGIMKSHGGAVVVDSQPGQGASFALYFRAGLQAADAAQEFPAVVAPQAGRRVLFVDDETAIVEMAEHALTRLGHRVTAFTDPHAAMMHFYSSPDDFDVVVSDLSMPGMSGFELARELLALRPAVPVVVTTGWMRGEEERTAKGIGIRTVLLKPVSIAELSDVIERMGPV